MKTVLVTGAGGFFGRTVLQELAAHHEWEITAVSSGLRPPELQETAAFRTETANLLDPEEAKRLIGRVRPETLLHLAWGRQDGPARSSAVQLQWLEASLGLLRSFAEAGGKQFVFAGSSAEYEGENGLRKEEETHADPEAMSLYGQTKRAFSEVAANFCARSGILFTDARLFTLYGPGDPHELGAIPLCTRTLLRNETFVCTSPATVRDYVYVRDAARALGLLTEREIAGAVNIASGRPRSMREVFGFLARELGREELLRFENEDRCGQILVGDNSVLRGLGFSEFTPFEDGMRRTLAWWRERSA